MALHGGTHVQGTELSDVEVALYRGMMFLAATANTSQCDAEYKKYGRVVSHTCYVAAKWAKVWAAYCKGNVTIHEMQDALHLGYVPEHLTVR